ncbi:MAG: penicillin-insensitive murein endopeptidase [Myxococcota bacterium]|jgi:penicillin-insensitive murein endopeptidase
MPLSWSSLAVVALLAAPTAGPSADPSHSVGHPYSGKLRGGVALPLKGKNYQVRWKARANRWLYGTRTLVEGIRHTALDLQALGGAPLVVGNLSRRRGGDLPCSRSHNTGRDVDFGLYTLDRDGTSRPAAYHRFDKRGRSLEAGGRYRFDVARNWALIESLLANPQFEVVALVLNPHLERMVLEHARGLGVDSALVARADRLLDRPSWANLHRNHLHLRIACPAGHVRCVD